MKLFGMVSLVALACGCGPSSGGSSTGGSGGSADLMATLIQSKAFMYRLPSPGEAI